MCVERKESVGCVESEVGGGGKGTRELLCIFFVLSIKEQHLTLHHMTSRGIYLHICIRIYIHIYIYICICICVYIYMHMHTHTHIHIHLLHRMTSRGGGRGKMIRMPLRGNHIGGRGLD